MYLICIVDMHWIKLTIFNKNELFYFFETQVKEMLQSFLEIICLINII